MPSPAGRETRIDLLRGFAMTMLAINHVTVLVQRMGFPGWRVPVLSSFGYSSAADLFVFLSGYMVGLVYFRKADWRARIGARIGELNVLVFGFCFAMMYALPAALLPATGFGYFLDHPVSGTLRFLSFSLQPFFLDVLHLYVVLMAVAFLFGGAILARPRPALALSLALYASVHLAHWAGVELTLPGGPPEGDWHWTFNPLAWQVLFVAAIVAGQRGLLSRLLRFMDERPLYAIAAFGLLVAAVLAYKLSHEIGYQRPLAWQANLGPLRILHAALVLAGLCGGLVLAKPFLGLAPFRLVAALGRNTLHCFVFSIPITYAMAGLCIELGDTQGAYLLAVAGSFTLIALVALARERRGGKPGVAAPAS